jgi:Spy/CpxP family protein refolding chaperone
MNRALKWKLIVGFVLVFVAGGMTGAFLGASHARHLFFAKPHRGMMSQRMRDHYRAQLNLTPEQVAKISPIIDKTAVQLEQIRHETGERVHELFMEAHREMAAHLSDEQRTKLQAMEARHHQWMQHRPGFRWRHSPSPEKPE